MSEEEIKELIKQLGYKEFYRYYEEKNELIKDLQQKVEQLEKELQITANKCKQLENIRKEAIEYISTCNDEKILNSMFLDESYISNYGAKDLLNILNKGDE